MKRLLAVMMAVGLGFAGVSSAILVDYDVAGAPASYVEYYNDSPSDDGLEIGIMVNPGLDAVSFDLENGETSDPFAFFKIWTPEGSVNPGEDDVPVDIHAYLAFDLPDEVAIVSGETVGGRAGFRGRKQWGQVTWNNPSAPILAQVGDYLVEFEVSLSDEIFNYGGLWGTSSGPCWGATVQASVHQVGSTYSPRPQASPVPDGGTTMALLGAVLIGMGLFKMR